MAAPSITPLPTPPSRSQSPTTFSADADAFLGALPTFQSEANAQADYLDGLAVDVTADADAAQAAAVIAAGAANYQGDYNAGTTYQIGESVSYLGRRYVAKTINTGVTPVDGANWFVVPELPAPSTAGNLLTSDGTNWISAAPPPSGPSLEAIASGALADGSAVIVNADGTVSVVQESTAPSSPSVAGTGTFTTASANILSSVYDAAAQKVVVVYNQTTDSNRPYAVVGEVIGNSVTFGIPVRFDTASCDNLSIVYHTAAQKVVIAFRKTSVSNRGFCIVGTVSGTSISFGSDTQFSHSSGCDDITAVYHEQLQRVVVFYEDFSTFFGTAIVGTVSGTSISFGFPVTFASTSIFWTSSTYDPVAQRVLVAYRDQNDGRGKCSVGTVSGTSMLFGGAITFNAASTSQIYATYAANAQKIVIAYRDDDNSNFGTVRVGTVSGSSVVFGSEIVFKSSSINIGAIAYDDAAQKVVIFYDQNFAITGLVSGTSITFGNGANIISGSAFATKTAYDPNTKKVIVPFSAATRDVALVSSVGSNMTSSNFVGFSDGAYADGQTATVQTVGSFNEAQSGLTAGLGYYVQYDGTLGNIPSAPSVFAGTAVSATKIIVKG